MAATNLGWGGAVQLVLLAATSCNSLSCPTVYEDGDGDVVVQGWVPDQRDAEGVPAGEARVKIPRSLLLAAARELPESEPT
jgi:hypothetical protein